MTLQEELLEILGDRCMRIVDLINEAKLNHPAELDFTVRSAILPLISSGELLLDIKGRVRKAEDVQ